MDISHPTVLEGKRLKMPKDSPKKKVAPKKRKNSVDRNKKREVKAGKNIPRKDYNNV